MLTRIQAAAGRDATEVADANKFDANRKEDPVGAFSHGSHECFGRHIALAFVSGLVKLSASLKGLRPAMGQMGEVKTVTINGEKLYLNDSWSWLSFDPSSTFLSSLRVLLSSFSSY